MMPRFPTLSLITCLVAGLLTTMSPAAEDPVNVVELRKALQERQEDFVKLEVNTKKAEIKFENFDYKGKTFVKDGKTYFAFRFTAPEKGGELVWSFRKPEGLFGWYIVPAEGDMKGFCQKKCLKEDVPDVGKKG